MSDGSGRPERGGEELRDPPEGARGSARAPASEENSEPDDDERVDESGRESFPASDPPGFWAGSDVPRRPDPA